MEGGDLIDTKRSEIPLCAKKSCDHNSCPNIIWIEILPLEILNPLNHHFFLLNSESALSMINLIPRRASLGSVRGRRLRHRVKLRRLSD